MSLIGAQPRKRPQTAAPATPLSIALRLRSKRGRDKCKVTRLSYLGGQIRHDQGGGYRRFSAGYRCPADARRWLGDMNTRRLWDLLQSVVVFASESDQSKELKAWLRDDARIDDDLVPVVMTLLLEYGIGSLNSLRIICPVEEMQTKLTGPVKIPHFCANRIADALAAESASDITEVHLPAQPSAIVASVGNDAPVVASVGNDAPVPAHDDGKSRGSMLWGIARLKAPSLRMLVLAMSPAKSNAGCGIGATAVPMATATDEELSPATPPTNRINDVQGNLLSPAPGRTPKSAQRIALFADIAGGLKVALKKVTANPIPSTASSSPRNGGSSLFRALEEQMAKRRSSITTPSPSSEKSAWSEEE